MSAVLRPQRQVAGGLRALVLLGLVALSADLLRREEARGT